MINKIYLQDKNIMELKSVFKANKFLPSLIMEKFFDEKTFKKIKLDQKDQKFSKKIEPMHASYSISSAKMQEIKDKEVLEFLSKIIGKKVKRIEGKIYSFGWKDYTLLNDEAQEKPGYDLMLDLNKSWEPQWGGCVVYTDGKGESNRILPRTNCLVLVQRKKGMQKYVKYVNNLSAKKKRCLFIGKLQV